MLKENLVVRGARIGFRNFSGEEGKFNPKGRRTFSVFFEPEHGAVLEREGWNIKWLDPRDDGEEATPYLNVRVAYTNIPPKISLVTKRGMTILDEDSVGMLDWADIEDVDLELSPYNWEVNGKKGVTAYVKTMYVTIVEDVFADKYSDRNPILSIKEDSDSF